MKRLSLALLLLLSACPPSQSGPEAVFRRFVTGVQNGDVDGAWSLLSHGTQEALTSYVQHQRELGAKVPDDPRQAVLGDAKLAQPIEDLTVKQAGEERTVLSVKAGGVTNDVTMVKEDGAWRISLTEQLR
jgi:hypothetical protein